MKVNDLIINNYYINVDNGLCIYKGTQYYRDKLYYLFEYAKNEQLMLSEELVNESIRKYDVPEGRKLKLNKLRDNKSWLKTKTDAENKAREQAQQLIKLYAERKNIKGFRFNKDTEKQLKFESSFPFELTEDQLRVIVEIKEDMESDKVLDRLIYGDVGSGKTCVAMCIIFKVVKEGYQSILLVPTTILAQQHYNNFKNIFEKFSINVACLCSNTKPKEKKQIIQDYENGVVDVLIGTHSVISDKINYKNTELLVTDEEQEFSLKIKNHIKTFKSNINILTMSATFIPRTLYMSMAGITDISYIRTSPKGKKPIDTKVVTWDDEVIKEYINRELQRDGQIYFLQNDIDTMENIKNKLLELVPELKVELVHGKMNKKDIEQNMNDFKDHKYDLLIATSIIKTGVDIQNVNTMIISESDLLGLSSLYQLRGRVGRNSTEAYCLLVTDNKQLSDTAIKRLKVLENNIALDSGLIISREDLSIRGQGELFGYRQHGTFPKVGMELFNEILENEIKKQKEKEDNKEDNDTKLCLLI